MNLLSRFRTRAQRFSPTTRKGIKGVGWATAAQAFAMVTRLASTLILTRLLAPSAFGLVGTAQAILETLTFFSDVGLVPALVRHEHGGTRPFLLTAFWINLGRMLLIGAFMAALAIPLANFYKQPELAPVLFVLALRPIALGLRSPGLPLLYREMRFRAINVQEMILQGLSVIVTVAMVYFVHRSALSMATGTLIATLIATVTSYPFAPMRPVWMWDKTAARELGHFGRTIFFNTLAMALWMNIDRIFGLRLVSAGSIGLYTVAWSLCGILNALSSRVCANIYYPMLLKQPEGPARLRWHDRMSRFLAFVAMPALGLAIVAAPLVILVLYDDRWMPASILLAVLIGQSMFRIINIFEYQYLLSVVAVPIQTRAYIAATVAQVTLFVPLVRGWGALGMAVSSLISAGVLATAQSVLARFKTGRGGFWPLLITWASVVVGLFGYWVVWR